MSQEQTGGSPLDELKHLDEQVEAVKDLADLKPIFYRLEEVAKQHASDFEVQLAVADIKQHLMNKGMRLKEPGGAPPPLPLRAPAGTTPSPAVPGPTVGIPRSSGARGAEPPKLQQPSPPTPPGPATPQPPPIPGVTPPKAGAFPPIAIPPKGTTPSTGIPTPTPPGSPAPPKQEAPKSQRPAPPFGPQTPTEAMPAAGLPGSGEYATKPAPPGSPAGAAGAGIPPVSSPGPQQQPPTPPQPPRAGKPQKPRPAGAKPTPLNWKRALWIGGLGGAIVTIAGIVIIVQIARRKNFTPAAATVPVTITTNPPGASIRINNEVKCTSNCKLNLAPGNYQVTAFLDGYEPAASGVTVAAGAPISVNLALEAQTQTVRVLTDLESGKVTMDGQPPVDLQDGQLILDKVANGSHSVKIQGRNVDASFTFTISPAKAPEIQGPVPTRNLLGILVSSFGTHARVVTSTGPLKVSVNGQAQGEAGPNGLDLTNFAGGVEQIVVGEGKDEKSIQETFGPAPMLTAFFKSDLNVGTLIVVTGEDNTTIYLNNREYRRKTERGQVRIQTLGKVTVRVSKPGFQSEPQQLAGEVKKGEETRLEFKLKPLPQVASLQIRGGLPGTQVVLDQKTIGTVGADGAFSHGNLTPGEHTVELRRDQYQGKKLVRQFKAGETVMLTAPDVTLAAVGPGTVHISRTPAEAKVTYRRADETQSHEVAGAQVELPAGSYIFTADAPNYGERSEKVTIAAGQTVSLQFVLPHVRAPEPRVTVGDMSEFADISAWKKADGVYIRKGGGFALYKITPAKGVFTFTVQLLKGGGLFRGGHIRWVLDYKDARNYALFDLDKKNFTARDVVNGKSTDRDKTSHGQEKEKSYEIQIDVSPDRIVHRMHVGDQWMVLDSWTQPGRDFTQGKFGFLIQGNDEIGISDFKFTSK